MDKSADLDSGNRSISFTIPGLPLSMNAMYQVLWHQRRIELKQEARAWKSKAKEFIPKFHVKKDERVSVEFLFFGTWLNKDGGIMKRDVTNREKLVLDAISEKCGFDDSQVWSRTVSKVHDQRERVQVRLFILRKDPE